MKKLAIIALIICTAFAFTACSGTQSRNWNISGMNCMACEGAVRNILEDIGVTVTSISARGDNVQFQFNPSDISEDEIIAALANGGYHIIE